MAGAGIAVTVTVGAFTFTMTDSGEGAGSLKSDAPNRARPASKGISAAVKADFKRTEATLAASGYKTSLAMRFDTDCAALSYGRVQKFFKSNPCNWLARAYVQMGSSEVLVAISWVGMPDATLAEKYKQLIDMPGAGNVTELSRVTTLYRKISYTDSPHISGMNGIAVWNVQVKPVFPKTTAEITKILLDSRQ